MVSPVRGLRYWRAARDFIEKIPKPPIETPPATGKGIGDGREHATHVGVGTRLGYVRSATTRAESSTLFIQVPVLASVRVSVSRYPRSSGTDPPGFHRAGRTGADAGIRDPCHREGHSAPEWLGYMVLGMPSQTNGRGVRACARRWR